MRSADRWPRRRAGRSESSLVSRRLAGGLDRHLACALLRPGKRDLDLEDAVVVGRPRLVRNHVRPELHHPPEWPMLDLELLVEAAGGLRGATLAGDNELAAADLEPDPVGVHAGQLGPHDRPRWVAVV